MELKYGREWEPVYQAFLLLPLVQVAPANPVKNRQTTWNFFMVWDSCSSPK